MLGNSALAVKRNPNHSILPTVVLADARPGHVRHFRPAYHPLGALRWIGDITEHLLDRCLDVDALCCSYHGLTSLMLLASTDTV